MNTYEILEIIENEFENNDEIYNEQLEDLYNLSKQSNEYFEEY